MQGESVLFFLRPSPGSWTTAYLYVVKTTYSGVSTVNGTRSVARQDETMFFPRSPDN